MATQQAGIWTINSHQANNRTFQSWVQKETMRLRPREEKSWQQGIDQIEPQSDRSQAICSDEMCQGSPDSWNLCRSHNKFVPQFSWCDMCLQHDPNLWPPLSETDLMEQVFHFATSDVIIISLSIITTQPLKIKLIKVYSCWQRFFTYYFSTMGISSLKWLI